MPPELLVLPEDPDLLRALYGVGRDAPADRPHVALNAVSSLDGGIAHGNVSAPLSSPADRRLFHVLRGLADVVLVGAGTARAERYRPVRPDPGAQAFRRDRGQAPAARVAVVTRSLDLDTSTRLFEGEPEQQRPLVLAPADADPQRLRAVAARADVVAVGEGEVDVVGALQVLAREHGVREVLGEGGGALNGHLVRADVVDELDLTLAPLVVAGTSPRAVTGEELPEPGRWSLVSLRAADGSLFLRYRRAGAALPARER